MVPTTTSDAILNGMLAALAALTPATGQPVTTSAYVRTIGRFLGLPQQGNTAGRSQVEAVLADGIAGRTPAIQVAFDKDERIATTIGRRVDKLRGFFSAYCVSDRRGVRDTRAFVLGMCTDVRKALGARQYSLPIRPMFWMRNELLFDTDQALIYAVRFSTVYRVDYSIDPGPDVMASIDGGIGFPTDDGSPITPIVGTEETFPGDA